MQESRDLAPSGPGVRLELLGGTALKSLGKDRRDIPAVLHQPKRFGLLAWLALHGRTGFTRRDELIGVFWPNHDTERGRNALRQAVHFLRQHLGAESIVGRGDEELGIDRDKIQCDAAEFEEALERGQREGALDLYKGDLMPSFFLSETPTFEQWLESSRQRLHQRAVAAAWELAHAFQPGTDSALEWARRAVALNPNDESGVRRLIGQLVERGDRAGAVQTFDQLEARLRELDLAPSASMRKLVADVRAGRSEFVAAPDRPASIVAHPVAARSSEAQGAVQATAPIQSAFSPPPERTPSRSSAIRWRVSLASAAAIAIALWAYRASRPSQPPLDADVVAVAPFDVLDASLSLWQTGMATVISANLDGAGPLRASPPSIAIRRWKGPTDRTALADFARGLGAGLAVGGRLVRAGPDSVRMAGTLVDARGRVLLDTEIVGPEERLAEMADSLTLRVLRTLGRERPIGAVRRQAIGSTSMSALRPFLRGEQFYRAAQWDSAAAYYRVAIAEDRAFAPAVRRLAATLSWLGTVFDDSARTYRLIAGTLNHGLARRESLVVQAESVFASLETDTKDAAWWQRRARLYETLGVVQRDYPDDPEGWGIAGETMFHYGGHPVTEYDRALATFDRAIESDSAFTSAYVHAISIATRLGDVPRGRRYAQAYLSRAGSGVTTYAARLYLLAADSSPNHAAISALIENADAGELFEAWSALRDLGDSAEVALAIVRRLAGEDWQAMPFADEGFGQRFLFGTLLLRGHVREASRRPTGRPESVVELAMVGALRPADADRMFDEWVARARPDARFALPWWADRRDTTRIRLFLARQRQRGLSDSEYDARLALSYLLLARGDSAPALAALESLADTLHCVPCAFPRLTRAKLLLASGENAKAAQHLTTALLWTTQEPLLGSVLWDLYRGVAAERLGDTTSAVRSYRRVARHWRNADPELQPYARQAREGIARLSRRQ